MPMAIPSSSCARKEVPSRYKLAPPNLAITG
jgi:hypothetical protein